MKIIIIIFIMIGGFMYNSYAQQALNYTEVNNKSLHYYYQKEWKLLIKSGKEFNKQGFESKALNYRIAIAYYELGKYNEALSYFKKVEKETIFDRTLQEYIYYSYLWGGRTADARLYASKMGLDLLKKVNYKQWSFLDGLNIEGGLKLSSLLDSVSNMPFFQIGLRHNLGNRLQLYHHFSFITQNYQGLYYNQYEYYARAEFSIMRGLQLVGAFHYTGLEGHSLIEYNSIVKLGIRKDFNTNGAVGLLGLQGNLGNLKWKTSASFSNWNNRIKTTISLNGGVAGVADSIKIETTNIKAFQLDLALNYKFAFSKKMWLSVGGYFDLQWKQEEIKPIWTVNTYWQINPKLGIELYYGQANTTYYNQGDAYWSSNTIGQVNGKVGLSANYQITPQINWSVDYSYEKRQTENFNFNYHILSTGLKFKL